MNYNTFFRGVLGFSVLSGIAVAQSSGNSTESNWNQNQNCSIVDDINHYNASGVYTMPGLTVNSSTIGSAVISNDDKPWTLTYQIDARSGSVDASANRLILETSNLVPEDLAGCSEGLFTYSVGKYSFRKEVLERSVNDTGDCKVMMGEACVNALKTKYSRTALQSIGRSSCTSIQIDSTIPAECAGLSVTNTSWAGGVFRSSLSFDNPVSARNTSTCDPPVQGNDTTYWVTATGNNPDYEPSIIFPRPIFLFFYPNDTTSGRSYSQNDVFVQILCPKGANLVEGSIIPRSAQELLTNATYANSSYTPSASTGLAVPMKTASPLMGAVAAGLALAMAL